MKNLVQGHGLENRPHGTGLDATEVEQVRQERVQPISGLRGTLEQCGLVRRGECRWCRPASVESGGLDARQGVRRSCETAASNAVRTASDSRRRVASAARAESRLRSRTAAAWAAKASSIRRSEAGRGDPDKAITRPGPASTATSATSTDRGGSSPDTSTTTMARPSAVASNNAALRMPNVSQAWSSSALTPLPRPRTPTDKEARTFASARRRAASCARAALRSTIVATTEPTMTNVTIAKAFSGSAIVKVPTGATKKKLTRSPATTAVATAGIRPPTSEVATTPSRKASRTVDRLSAVTERQERERQHDGNHRGEHPGPDATAANPAWAAVTWSGAAGSLVRRRRARRCRPTPARCRRLCWGEARC